MSLCAIISLTVTQNQKRNQTEVETLTCCPPYRYEGDSLLIPCSHIVV